MKTLELECSTKKGNPLPTIRWFKNDYPLGTRHSSTFYQYLSCLINVFKDINSNILFSNRNRKLTIRRVSKYDIGKYKCLVENDAGRKLFKY